MSQAPNAVPSPAAKPGEVPTRRLMSLDALRGFDMFWIIGAEPLVAGLRKVSNSGWIREWSHQLEHVAWAGFHFEDLIFPMFVFIVGVSIVFSLGRTIEQHGRRAAMVRIFRRALLLYLLGIFYYGGFSTPLTEIRLLGVLQRIALCYLCAGLIFCFWGLRGRVIWCVGLLVGYWLVMTLVPVPGGVAGNFAEGHNLANWVDQQYLPLRKWDIDHDPEGLLSTLPAIANCLIGVLVGMLLAQLAPQRLEEGRLSGLGRCVTRGIGLALELAVPGDQEDLDIFVRARRLRIQLPVAGNVPPGDRSVGLATVGSALCLDRHESDHDVYDRQPGQRAADCRAACWTRSQQVFWPLR